MGFVYVSQNVHGAGELAQKSSGRSSRDLGLILSFHMAAGLQPSSGSEGIRHVVHRQAYVQANTRIKGKQKHRKSMHIV